MGKSMLYKLFGLGKLPKKMAPVFENEGIILADEGVKGSVTLRKFRAPRRYHSYKKSFFAGSIIITEKRFAAFTFSRPVINVPVNDKRLKELKMSITGEDHFFVKFDAAKFHNDWSGSVECLFITPKAYRFREYLRANLR